MNYICFDGNGDFHALNQSKIYDNRKYILQDPRAEKIQNDINMSEIYPK